MQNIEKKVGVLKVSERSKINDDKRNEKSYLALALLHFVQQASAEKIDDNAKYKQNEIASAGFIIEEKTCKEKERIPQHHLAV